MWSPFVLNVLLQFRKPWVFLLWQHFDSFKNFILVSLGDWFPPHNNFLYALVEGFKSHHEWRIEYLKIEKPFCDPIPSQFFLCLFNLLPKFQCRLDQLPFNICMVLHHEILLLQHYSFLGDWSMFPNIWELLFKNILSLLNLFQNSGQIIVNVLQEDFRESFLQKKCPLMYFSEILS